MSIQALRRLLAAANGTSVLALLLVLTAFAQRSPQDRSWPSFTIEGRSTIDPSSPGRAEHVAAPLGKWREASAPAGMREEPVAAPSRLADLGTIVAVVAARSSGADDQRTSIAFRLRSGDVRTIALGEALETKPHSRYGSSVRVSSRFRLVGCEGAGAAVHLLFDTDCDGVDLQAMDWDCRAESKAADLRGVVIPAREFDRTPH